MTISISNPEAIISCDAIVDSIDTGGGTAQLVVYDGSVPTNVDTGLSGNTVLAELDMANPAFGAAGDDTPGAIATANAISDDTSANAAGTASFFRILDRAGTATIQGTVTATGGGGDLEFNSIIISAGSLVRVTSLTITVPES